MSETACATDADFALADVEVARLLSCSTVENCAICAVHCELSCGDDGSWCWSWATRSLRKVSLSIIVDGSLFFAPPGAATGASVMLPDWVAPVLVTSAMARPSRPRATRR